MLLAYAAFLLYLQFKIIEFILVAANLYRKMVRQQAAMVSLLVDIRDNTRQFDATQTATDDEASGTSLPEDLVEQVIPEGTQILVIPKGAEALESEFCYHCGEILEGKVSVCPKCGKDL